MKYLRNFNQKLLDTRHQKKLALEDVAMMCGVAESVVRSWELLEEDKRQYPDVDQLMDLCVKASIPLEAVLDLDTSASAERQLVLPGLDVEDDVMSPPDQLLKALAELDGSLETSLPTEEERVLLRRFRSCDAEKQTFIMQMLPSGFKTAGPNRKLKS